ANHVQKSGDMIPVNWAGARPLWAQNGHSPQDEPTTAMRDRAAFDDQHTNDRFVDAMPQAKHEKCRESFYRMLSRWA
ncbi:hypothetical protein, partial [Boseongicola aestuarii]|uniref:hypothetical protein n=1 Tax=Boseongicola aestuarii TaxID=1470561 RepID=UPI001C3E1D0E